MTTDEVNALGDTLVSADCAGDPERIRTAAYDLLHSLAVEHDRADCLAARVHFLAGGGRLWLAEASGSSLRETAR